MEIIHCTILMCPSISTLVVQSTICVQLKINAFISHYKCIIELVDNAIANDTCNTFLYKHVHKAYIK